MGINFGSGKMRVRGMKIGGFRIMGIKGSGILNGG
jgi:hypothetical protein